MIFLNSQEPSENLLYKITPEWAWGGSTGKGVKVAVVDSGIDETHPELAGSVKEGIEIITGWSDKPEPVKGIMGDSFGHGTACAGIIRSIAPEVEFYSVKVLGEKLSGTGDVMMSGIKWAVDNGMDMANLSLGTTKLKYYAGLHKIADGAYFNKCLLVVALSNRMPVSYPAVFSSVIGVKAVKEDNPFSFYLNPSPPVEIFARGVNVRIPWVKHGYFTATGNSFAAPVITGISALIKSKHPELCPLGIKLVINTLAKKWADYGKITPPLLTLDELSRETSVPKESLERYIEEGIIFPEEGNENKEPLFYEQNIVKSIRTHILSSQDFTVEEIIEKVRN